MNFFLSYWMVCSLLMVMKLITGIWILWMLLKLMNYFSARMTCSQQKIRVNISVTLQNAAVTSAPFLLFPVFNLLCLFKIFINMFYSPKNKTSYFVLRMLGLTHNWSQCHVKYSRVYECVSLNRYTVNI